MITDRHILEATQRYKKGMTIKNNVNAFKGEIVDATMFVHPQYKNLLCCKVIPNFDKDITMNMIVVDSNVNPLKWAEIC